MLNFDANKFPEGVPKPKLVVIKLSNLLFSSKDNSAGVEPPAQEHRAISSALQIGVSPTGQVTEQLAPKSEVALHEFGASVNCSVFEFSKPEK